jgi:hypothetical protein
MPAGRSRNPEPLADCKKTEPRFTEKTKILIHFGFGASPVLKPGQRKNKEKETTAKTRNSSSDLLQLK